MKLKLARKKRKIWVVSAGILLLTVLFTLSGTCVTFAKTKLTFLNWAPLLREPQQKFWIEAYEKLHPEVEIEGLWIPWGAYWAKVQSMMVTQEQMDILYMSVAFVEEFARKGFLVNLQPFMDRDINWEDWYPQGFTPALKYPLSPKGDLYEFPNCFDVNVLFYNQDMFDKAGVPHPDKTWDWPTLVDTAKRLTFDTNADGEIDQWGYYVTTDYYFFDSYLASMGQPLLSEDYSRCMLDQPKAVEAVRLLVDMIQKDYSAPSPAATAAIGQPFQAGMAAMSIWSSNFLETNQKPPYRWDCTLVPKGPGGRINMVFPNGVSIGKTSKNPEIAWDFVKFISMNKEARIKADWMGRPPAYKPIALSPEWKEHDLSGSGIASLDAMLEAVGYGPEYDANFFCEQWMKWRITIIDSELAPAFMGDESVEEACKAAAKEATKVLQERLQR